VVDKPGGGSLTVYVAGGVLKVEDDVVTVLTEYAGEAPPAELPPEAVFHQQDVKERIEQLS
jgi:F0F1-type ATP synthase epsilon subunit